MQKSRINLMLCINVAVLYALAAALIADAGTLVLVIVAIAMALSVIVPMLLLRKGISRVEDDLKKRSNELKVVRDQLEGMKSHMAKVTTVDDLTGCYNNRHFMELLTQHRAMSERGSYLFTLIVVQVDQFADIVDLQGLGRGNEVLQLFARIVKAALREVDVLARLEADKFGLILSGCSEEDALIIIHRISQLIGQIQVNEDDDIKVTASGGLTSFHGTETPDDLIAHAEQALEFAIEQGRDRVAGYLYAEPEASSEEG
ncbi:MAG: GGDEF domain-containing protein [Pseudomonadales bacterium]|nr:GGDEF domain-containing protein [Pseudomonadales bacterium]